MTIKRPNDYLSNSNLLEEILKSQAIQAKLPDEEKWDRAAECLTRPLVEMITLLVTRIATSYRWRNYTWIEDMKGEAELSLCRVCLKFDLSKVPDGSYANPFAYFSQIITRVFITMIDREKKQGKIRDEIIEGSETDLLPSYGRQNEQVGNSLGLDLDGTKRIKSDPHKRRRRKKPKVIKEDDMSKMSDAEQQKWVDRKVAEFRAKPPKPVEEPV
jgi:hypothetical protein